MDIKLNGSQASGKGPEEYFTGSVRVDPLFTAPEPSRGSGALVTFEPGARSARHWHPLGQTLIVMSGRGWVQSEGEPKIEIRPGDVVWCPPNERHCTARPQQQQCRTSRSRNRSTARSSNGCKRSVTKSTWVRLNKETGWYGGSQRDASVHIRKVIDGKDIHNRLGRRTRAVGGTSTDRRRSPGRAARAQRREGTKRLSIKPRRGKRADGRPEQPGRDKSVGCKGKRYGPIRHHHS